MTDKYDIEEIFNTYQELGSFTAVAKAMGITRGTASKYVNKYHSQNSVIASETTRTGIPFDKVARYWLKTKNKDGDDVSVLVENSSTAIDVEELRETLVDDLKNFSPIVNKIIRNTPKLNEKHLLVIDPADVHIGKLAVSDETGHADYNTEIAVSRMYTGTEKLLAAAKPHGVEEIVILIGNDILHVDDTKSQTTAGTHQDFDSMWYQMFTVAREIYVTLVEMCKEIAPVTLVYCPSNHDDKLGFTLMDSLFSWYRSDANVTVSNYGKSRKHRKYIRYGDNLIGVTHGDGAKNKDLTSLMQFEAREEWGTSKFAYWYVHHLHHKYRIINGVEVEKDYNGVTVIGATSRKIPKISVEIECVRSPSTPDSWHSKKGYVASSAMEAFLHHPTGGQIGRYTTHF